MGRSHLASVAPLLSALLGLPQLGHALGLLRAPRARAQNATSVGAAAATVDGPILVDFHVFLGNDMGQTGVAPRASMNIGGQDKTSGFWVLCHDSCPSTDRGAGSVPLMRFCRCIAERSVEDLNADFGALLPQGSEPLFAMGDYIESDAGQDYFNIDSGHQMLYSLMKQQGSDPYARKPGRVTVWVANYINSGNQGKELAGTTLLDQVLYEGTRGAGVLLKSDVARRGKRLSHETGHVVGFHHTAGPQVQYTYSHEECPADEGREVQWKMASKATCEVNIMGGWYDRNGCPKQQPDFTFATEEAKDMLAAILHCWMHLRGSAPPAQVPNDLNLYSTNSTMDSNMTSGLRSSEHRPMVCMDFADSNGDFLDSNGPCTAL